MEEILASIRRIIADEEPAPGSAPASNGAVHAGPAAEETLDSLFAAEEEGAVLDLTDALAEDDREPAMAPEEADISFAEDAAETPEPEPVAPSRPHPPRARGEDDRLLSAEAGSTVQEAFNTLAHTILASNTRTLEDLVKEMLRPMLKGWLDENLPAIVERLVRQEIERVSRGR